MSRRPTRRSFGDLFQGFISYFLPVFARVARGLMLWAAPTLSSKLSGLRLYNSGAGLQFPSFCLGTYRCPPGLLGHGCHGLVCLAARQHLHGPEWEEKRTGPVLPAQAPWTFQYVFFHFIHKKSFVLINKYVILETSKQNPQQNILPKNKKEAAALPHPSQTGAISRCQGNNKSKASLCAASANKLTLLNNLDQVNTQKSQQLN